MLLPERLVSVREFSDELRLEDSVARTHGVRFVVRDMGNGVLRLESSVLDPIGYLRRDAMRHGRYRIEPPCPDWMMDMVHAAVCAAGVDPCPVHHRVHSLAYARPVGDHCIQILGWRHPAFFTLRR